MEFELTKPQLARYRQGKRTFYCTPECYHSRPRKRDAHTLVPIEPIREAAVEAVEKGEYTWASLAFAVGFHRKKGGKTVAASYHMKRTLGLVEKEGKLPLMRRETARRFVQALGMDPEKAGL